VKARAFAEGTTVSASKSRAEIESTVTRFGATRFVSGYDTRDDGSQQALVEFTMVARRVRFILHLPSPSDGRFVSKRGYPRRPDPRKHEAEVRRLWRALLLGIKAKLELARSGIATFEEEFLAHIVMPGTNRTVGEHALPALETAYSRDEAVAFLPESTP